MAKQLPDILSSGEAARLFPVLAETSKEGRTLSIFLACLENVPAFGRSMLRDLDVGFGVRGRVDTFTEVVLKRTNSDAKHRPDGLIVVNTGRSVWTALVEAKVGASELTNTQIEAYLALAKLNGIDAVITVSNQFTSLPTHHPLTINANLRRKVDLFHWSWGYVITQTELLRKMGEIEDREQLILLSELQRFLLHPSSGVKEFDQMPAAWSELCQGVSNGAAIEVKSAATMEVVGAWHQSLDRLASVLSRQLGAHVTISMSRSESSDPAMRSKGALEALKANAYLMSDIVIPDAAAPLKVCADIRKKVLTLQMSLKAPADRKSTRGRVTWLLRQLKEADSENIHIRLGWPGRAQPTQYRLSELRNDPEIAVADREAMTVLSFEVLLVKDLGPKFAQRKIFVSEIIRAASDFYSNIGARLSPWQAKPAKISEDRLEPASVSTDALRDQVEREAIERNA